MRPETQNFRSNTKDACSDNNLRSALQNSAAGFISRRELAVAACPEFQALRDKGRAIRTTTLNELDRHLVAFEARAQEAGSTVHWARTSEEACRSIADICANYQAKHIVKGKSMVSEEIGLNTYLSRHGFDVVETDLGEYLLQLRGEAPSHIIAPAVHVSEGEAGATFFKHHEKLDPKRALDTPAAIVAEARSVLRSKFLDADVGITGANFLIAETGSAVVVTNEGNGDLTATLPKHHIIVTSIDKVVPTLSDTGVLIELLARSATGQALTAYTSLFTGPKRSGDLDGPETLDIVLVDNARTDVLASDVSEVLNCIRCGACLNHCPIYANVGGHAYGWVYPGPIGAALNPGLLGVSKTRDLPHASTLCGRCEEVCPVRIPLPKLFRHWRSADFQGNRGAPYNLLISIWCWLAQRPRLYRVWARLMAWSLYTGSGRFKRLPFARAWTTHRDFPASERTTFHAQWRRREREKADRS